MKMIPLPTTMNHHPPSIDDDVPIMNITTDNGDVDTGDSTPTLPTDMAIGDTDNPTGVDGTIPMGPNHDTHAVNSDTAASPTLKATTTSAVDTGDVDMNDGASANTAP